MTASTLRFLRQRGTYPRTVAQKLENVKLADRESTPGSLLVNISIFRSARSGRVPRAPSSKAEFHDGARMS